MQFEWKMIIRKVDNGFIVEKPGDEPETLVFQEHPKLNDLGAMVYVLYEVMEYFAIYYSDHNEYNINISIIDKEGNEVDLDSI